MFRSMPIFGSLFIVILFKQADLQATDISRGAENRVPSNQTKDSINQSTRNLRHCGSCNWKKFHPLRHRRSTHASVGSTLPDSNLTKIIDLMVVYESTVKQAALAKGGINAVVAQAVEETNQCFSNSLIPLRIRVVHSLEVNYNLTSYLKDIDRLSKPSDGHIDEVFSIRDEYGADLVTLLSSIDGPTGGMADTLYSVEMPQEEINEFGFSVNLWFELGAPEYTLAHEIGHNLGCAHNREAERDTSGYLFPFAFGKRWFSENQGIRTVMSYDEDLVDTYPTVIPYFSNPLVYSSSVSTGNLNTEDNAQVIRRTASYVSNFRTSQVQGILPSSFDLTIQSGSSAQISLNLIKDPIGPLSVSAMINGSQSLSFVGDSRLSFDSKNWNTPQTIEISAFGVDQNHSAQLVLSAIGVESCNLSIDVITSSSAISEGLKNPKDWHWFNYYPWVYSNEEEGWIYFHAAGNKLLFYSVKNGVWREFSN